MVLHFFLALLLATSSGPAEAGRHIDGPGPTRVLDLAGSSVNPLVLAPRRVATVLVFTTTDCPISNRYAPEIQRLAARFDKQGVGFTLVYPVSTDTPNVIREHVKKFGYAAPVVRDMAQELVKHTGVQVTPEVAVVGAGGRVLYKGRIDDRYVEFGKDRPEPTERNLERALESIVAGRPVAVRETRAVGCILADLVK